MRTYSSLLMVIMAICLFSCTPDNPDSQIPPSTSKPDTLSTGWRKIKVCDENLADIIFENKDIGYVLGDSLYKSIDGGLTWKALNTSISSGINLTLSSNRNLYTATSYPGILYKSINQGVSFVKYNIPRLKDIIFYDNNIGFAFSNDNILLTEDAAVTWTSIALPPNIFDVQDTYTTGTFVDINNICMVYNKTVLNYNRQTNTWIVNDLSFGAGLNNVMSISANKVFAGGVEGRFYISNDGGLKFNFIKQFPQPGGFMGFYFIDQNVGYLNYGNRIYKTIDGGINWEVVVALGESIFVEIYFTDANHGWACTQNGEVLKFN